VVYRKSVVNLNRLPPIW